MSKVIVWSSSSVWVETSSNEIMRIKNILANATNFPLELTFLKFEVVKTT
jgi:hypothetical protein